MDGELLTWAKGASAFYQLVAALFPLCWVRYRDRNLNWLFYVASFPLYVWVSVCECIQGDERVSFFRFFCLHFLSMNFYPRAPIILTSSFLCAPSQYSQILYEQNLFWHIFLLTASNWEWFSYWLVVFPKKGLNFKIF